MKKPNQQEAVCPHCHATQSEPVSAISTNCRACGRYFKLNPDKEERTAVRTGTPKASREVFCIKCGAPNLVAEAAMSTQCIRCLHYLELGDKIVRGVQTGKLYAYDDVVFAEGCSFKGMEATGRRIEVRGKVFSKLRATAEIVAFAGAQLSGELHAPVVRIEPGAKVKVQTIECARLRVAGDLEISGVLEATEILLAAGSTFSGRLNNPDAKLQVEAGARIDAESATCAEMIVEGELNLPGTVLAERVLVMAHGRMNVGRLNAASIEVSPGGMLQGLIEKYTPRPKPEQALAVDARSDDEAEPEEKAA
jgi:cytoskeletal protein CcmA (bactofilin family)/ribosomal protein L40E